MTSPLWINARFVTQPLTGVQRYACEVARRLPDAQLISPAQPRSEYSTLCESPRFHRSGLPIGGRPLAGHFWEQAILPFELPGDALLWSPGGSGPLTVQRQVLTIHDVACLEHPEWYSRAYARWYGWLLPRLANRCRQIITVSEFSASRIHEVLGVSRDRIHVVPLAADDRFRPLPPADVQLVLERRGIRQPYLIAVGALSSRKNITRLLAAWADVQSELNHVQLVVIGLGGLAFSDLSGGIVMPPQAHRLSDVTDDELVALYCGAIALVYPSLYEGFGLPPLEAMACGTPVLAAHVTALPENLGSDAIYFDPIDTSDMAKALRRIVHDKPLRHELSKAGLRRAARFSWDRTAAQIDAILHSA
jgi:glycosyltransferase involved in cell wall biosynthesis